MQLTLFVCGCRLSAMVGGDVVAVTLVGAGMPRKSMGWWHAVQLLEGRVPHARLANVVEPYFLGKGSSAAVETGFSAWRACAEAEHHVQFFAQISEMSELAHEEPHYAIISLRPADCAACYYELVAKGFKTIFIEKPGASNVAELLAMAENAASLGVSLAVGFMRNASPYLNEAHKHLMKEVRNADGERAASPLRSPELLVTHHNAFKPAELDECFARCAKGMLMEMLIHDLAFLVSHLGMSVADLAEARADTDFSLRERRGEHVDFVRLRLQLRSTSGLRATVSADRCGGDDCSAAVRADGVEEPVFSATTDVAATRQRVDALSARHPGLLSYFAVFDDEYVVLKERCAQHVLRRTAPVASTAGGKLTAIPGLESMGVHVAIEAMELAGYLSDSVCNAIAISSNAIQ